MLVIGVGLLVYSNSLHDAFVLDDLGHIVENPRIRQLWPPWEIIIHSSRPVVQLSVALNYALGGLNPWGYHAFNVGIHILAALLLYGVVRLTLLSEGLRSRFGDAAPWLAGVIALIWLVHPLQTESVTYVIQRGESLMGLFYLLTLYCVIRSSGPSRSIWWRAGAVASCAFGMATKPVMVTAPLVVLLYDRAFLAKSWRAVWERRWMLHASLAATCLLLPLLLANAPTEWKATAGFDFKGIPSYQYALTQAGVILHYLQLAFWPHSLCLDYGSQYGWPVAQAMADALPELAVVGVLLVGTLWAWRRKPALGFLGAWFFLILAPTSSFVPVADLIVEHRMYLPLAAVVAMVTAGGFVFGGKLLTAHQQTRKILPWGVSGVLVVVLASLTIQRNRDYRSLLTIWQDTVVKCPNNPRAHYNFGFALWQAGRTQEAINHYAQAVRIKPDFTEAHFKLGLGLSQAGELPEAIAHYEQALRLNPDYAEAHYNLGLTLSQVGKEQEAIAQYEQALRLKPDLTDAHNSWGVALVRLGRMPEAVGHWERALQIEPDNVAAHNNLGIGLRAMGRVEDAIAHCEQALRIKPDYADAHYNLGLALIQVGRLAEAMDHWEQALRINPHYAEVHYNLGLAMEQTDRMREAIGHYDQALRDKPDYPKAQNNLAWVLATHSPAEGGDPVRAVTLAERACKLTDNKVAPYLDTLAAAYAAASRFNDAIASAQQAIELARSAGQMEIANEIDAHLALYRSGRAYRR